MTKLDKDSMSVWYGLLPADVASCIEISELGEGESEATAIVGAIKGFKNGEDVVGFVAQNPERFLTIGRARRLRFLAWLMAGNYPDKGMALQALANPDDEEQGSEGAAGGVGKVAPYFKEDILALVEALGPRAARRIVDVGTLAAVTGAAYEVAGELEMRSGGGL